MQNQDKLHNIRALHFCLSLPALFRGMLSYTTSNMHFSQFILIYQKPFQRSVAVTHRVLLPALQGSLHNFDGPLILQMIVHHYYRSAFIIQPLIKLCSAANIEISAKQRFQNIGYNLSRLIISGFFVNDA